MINLYLKLSHISGESTSLFPGLRGGLRGLVGTTFPTNEATLYTQEHFGHKVANGNGRKQLQVPWHRNPYRKLLLQKIKIALENINAITVLVSLFFFFYQFCICIVGYIYHGVINRKTEIFFHQIILILLMTASFREPARPIRNPSTPLVIPKLFSTAA